MIKREAAIKLKALAGQFKAVAVVGARQTGKTTLVRQVFSRKPYVSLENPDTREFAITDPRGFLAAFPKGAILDEIQRVPQLFSYLQQILDEQQAKGLFILSGSNNFLLQQGISQSLAGRVAYQHLLPFSLKELYGASWLPEQDAGLMLKGFYPPVYDQHLPANDWYTNYIATYVDTDVRQLKNISDLLVFSRFLRLLAGRNGQELNLSALALEAGVDMKTAQSWIGVLESSFIIYLFRPYYRNFNKTIVKRPKLYFFDTGIVCSLLGIRDIGQLDLHPLKGAIFEGMVITELLKKRTNAGLPVNLFYWRDKSGREVDVVIDEINGQIPVEIKFAKTIQPEMFRNIEYWRDISGDTKALLLYNGDLEQKRSNGAEVWNWRSIMKKKIA